MVYGIIFTERDEDRPESKTNNLEYIKGDDEEEYTRKRVRFNDKTLVHRHQHPPSSWLPKNFSSDTFRTNTGEPTTSTTTTTTTTRGKSPKEPSSNSAIGKSIDNAKSFKNSKLDDNEAADDDDDDNDDDDDDDDITSESIESKCGKGLTNSTPIYEDIWPVFTDEPTTAEEPMAKRKTTRKKRTTTKSKVGKGAKVGNLTVTKLVALLKKSSTSKASPKKRRKSRKRTVAQPNLI